MTKDVVMERAAQATAVGAGSAAAFFGLTANEFAAIIGAAVAVLSLVAQTAISIYFKRQALRLQEQAAKTRPDCLGCPKLPEV